MEWLWEGDRNTAFFHAQASARKRTNRIKVLEQGDRSTCEDLQGLKDMIVNFFGQLFSTEPCPYMEEVLDAIQTRVDDQMNEVLCTSYSDKEVHDALFQMAPTKEPGPDGFPALFYQTDWDLIKEDICSAINSFLKWDSIPEGLYDSVIVLILKVSNPVHLSNFRLISLCNVLYKIASKVLANRVETGAAKYCLRILECFCAGTASH